MLAISYKEGKDIDKTSLLSLYEDAGWTAYTKNPDDLVKVVQNSQYVLSAWDRDKLVGLIRTVGDELSITYIQDLLVLKDYKRNKIGTTLVNGVLKKFPAAKRTLLLTDETEETRGFYESLGFESCDKGMLVAFIKT